ncbi:MAG: AbrB/MazE/SpoVT family DNA-binding domain-containing protein [Chloroflexota bacterium]|nr:MAG: AbrB/MazE/SpoVT family DNA-binding domain-containing protein [Chloroflexota bacterium]
MGRQGRIVIPAEIRRELAIEPGDKLIALNDDGELHLLTHAQLVKRLQDLFAHIPKGVSLADELISERREEARHEDDV